MRDREHTTILTLARDWQVGSDGTTFEAAIAEVYNARNAEMDGEGNIWIGRFATAGENHDGRWLTNDELGEISERLLRAGYIL